MFRYSTSLYQKKTHVTAILLFLCTNIGYSSATAPRTKKGTVRYLRPITKSEKLEHPPKNVNFFSGIPLTLASVDDGSSGFGDVASNVNQAIRMSKNHQDRDIRFIVTSLWEKEFRKLKFPSERIMEIMVPGLDSQQKKTPQKIDHVTYFFEPSLANNTISATNYYQNFFSKADLAINYSSLPLTSIDEYPIFKRGARVIFLVSEFGGESTPFIDILAPQRPGAAIVIALNSGAGSSGFYVDPEATSPFKSKTRTDARRELSEDLQRLGVLSDPIDQETILAFSYAKLPESTRSYVEALKQLAEQKKYQDKKIRLLINNVAEVDLEIPQPNLAITKLDSLPHEVFEKVVWSTDLPPLVTGDVSLSIALEATTPTKGFFYDTNKWKYKSMEAFLEKIKGDFEGFDPSDPDILDSILYWRTRRLHKNIFKSTIGNTKFWKTFHTAIKKQECKWSLSRNIELYYQLVTILEPGLSNKVYSKDFLRYAFSELTELGSVSKLPGHLTNALRNPGIESEEAKFAFFLWAVLSPESKLPSNLPYKKILENTSTLEGRLAFVGAARLALWTKSGQKMFFEATKSQDQILRKNAENFSQWYSAQLEAGEKKSFANALEGRFSTFHGDG